MLCPNCGTRWAEYPREDWEFRRDGFYPIKSGADKRRHKAFESDEEKICSKECEEDNEFGSSAVIESDEKKIWFKKCEEDKEYGISTVMENIFNENES